MILGGVALGSLVLGVEALEGLVTPSQVAAGFLHQLPHGTATVIARDVGVQVSPDPFDPVVVRAIRREEVQVHP
jgi:hypothetical protein